MVTLNGIDFWVEWEYETEHNETGYFKVINVKKVWLNDFEVTPAFKGELLEHLIERIEAVL
jgi:hypothetical protein